MTPRPATPVTLVTAEGVVVCRECRVAASFRSRLRGLLGTRRLGEEEGLIFPGTSSIHTHFMRYPIDVLFLDDHGRVRRIVGGLGPWRLAGCRGARDAVELPAGRCARLGLEEGATIVRAPAASAYPANRP